MKKSFYFSLLIFLFLKHQAQFQAVLTEGDFIPASTKMSIDEKNTKHKDAPHVYFDNTRNLWHATWTQFDSYKSKRKEDLSVVYYARSIEGKTWTSPKQLNSTFGDCSDDDNTLKGPMPSVGSGGEIYVTWIGPKGLMFQCSRDSGTTWLKEEKIINPVKGGWASKVDEIKTNGLPFITCDNSNGEFKGRVYITWSDEKNGEKNKDVFLVYSDDSGEHWTEPILVSYRPNHKEQFMPSIKVDSLTGYVYILYFDKQNFYSGKETDLTLALSKNGGLKFDYFKINEHPFLFNANFHEIIDNNGIRVRWVQAVESNRFDLYEVLVNDSSIGHYYLSEESKEMEIERSFKFADKITLDFTVKQNAFITAVITKPLEPGFEKLVVKEKRVFEGKNSMSIDMKLNGLKKGNYVLTLYYNSRNTFVWINEE
ncbi:sialidase family protein [Aurantibacillus circumpalustris]|uniref:sialidase family protein n=1 Tax=Aurantibacillus circumpalustris TaxID=3036359 RepID=UPI00295B398A|nr:sialidase family protein [Aurantibacillus circumpalustris]